jgi:hypothetical protein|tara:strand:+ start:1877 stop:2134 length:258 start_codon:yes stop_codon:yes gene_type:complete
MSIEIIDIVFLVMCVGILSALYMQHKKIKFYDVRILENKVAIKLINNDLQLLDFYLKNITKAGLEKTEKINTLVDRTNVINGNKK